MSYYDPLKHLDDLGVRVAYGGRGMEYSGIYSHDGRIVVLRPGMSERLERCVLTHEAVHAEYGDVPQWDGVFHQANELRADVIMANRLIGRRQWQQVKDRPVEEICERLDIVPHVVDVYERYCTHTPAAVMPYLALMRPRLS